MSRIFLTLYRQFIVFFDATPALANYRFNRIMVINTNLGIVRQEPYAMRSRFTGLWQHPEFMKLWTGETISLLGSQITLLALPLTAAWLLQADPRHMGLLHEAQVPPL